MRHTEILTVQTKVWDSSGKVGVWKYITARVRVEVDFEEIAKDIGAKATRNKSRVAKECKGAVVVTAIEVIPREVQS